jgi:hypothetical protein
MTEPTGGIRASDASRDAAAGTLADAVAVGRLSLAEPWAFALGEPRAHELASAIDRHFHITEASIREE